MYLNNPRDRCSDAQGKGWWIKIDTNEIPFNEIYTKLEGLDWSGGGGGVYAGWAEDWRNELAQVLKLRYVYVCFIQHVIFLKTTNYFLN